MAPGKQQLLYDDSAICELGWFVNDINVDGDTEEAARTVFLLIFPSLIIISYYYLHWEVVFNKKRQLTKLK